MLATPFGAQDRTRLQQREPLGHSAAYRLAYGSSRPVTAMGRVRPMAVSEVRERSRVTPRLESVEAGEANAGEALAILVVVSPRERG
jgi:hypothetical protein